MIILLIILQSLKCQKTVKNIPPGLFISKLILNFNVIKQIKEIVFLTKSFSHIFAKIKPLVVFKVFVGKRAFLEMLNGGHREKDYWPAVTPCGPAAQTSELSAGPSCHV